jgi:hypothetical protein
VVLSDGDQGDDSTVVHHNCPVAWPTLTPTTATSSRVRVARVAWLPRLSQPQCCGPRRAYVGSVCPVGYRRAVSMVDQRRVVGWLALGLQRECRVLAGVPLTY